MTEQGVLEIVAVGWIALAVAVFATLFFVTAPYGRHSREGWGPKLPFLTGWVIMEAPASLGLLFWFVLGPRRDGVVLAFLALWQLHYLHRAFAYPWVRRRQARALPLGVVLLAVFFNLSNTWLNGRWLFAAGPERELTWLTDPRFVFGCVVFLAGFGTNLWADHRLRTLRKPGETGYKIPRGGLFRYVSCPHYLGEIIEWAGFALLTWSLPALAFALWTAANLAPRARSHHRWYQEKFADYPARRRALIPFLW